MLDAFGFDTVDAGPLKEGWRIQRDTPGYGPRRNAAELSKENGIPTLHPGANAFVELRDVRIFADGNNKEIARQQATTPLDLLPAGASLPVMTSFAPPLPAQYTASAAVVSLLPASEGAKRYIPVSVENQVVNILPDGLTAEASGEVLSAGDKTATQVWVVAIAYNAAGEVVGLRRWESSQPLPAGGRGLFSLRVYTAGDAIARLDLLAHLFAWLFMTRIRSLASTNLEKARWARSALSF